MWAKGREVVSVPSSKKFGGPSTLCEVFLGRVITVVIFCLNGTMLILGSLNVVADAQGFMAITLLEKSSKRMTPNGGLLCLPSPVQLLSRRGGNPFFSIQSKLR